MNIEELQKVLSAGEDSRHQFKRTFNNVDAISAEFTAMSNSAGGEIFVGVEDDGSIAGLNPEEIRQLNQSISNAASQCITPPISVLTEIITTEKGRVLVITVPQGEMGPYQDKQGIFWIKAGADKRKAASREEILRQFQKNGMLYAEETLVPKITIQDIDTEYFEWFYNKVHSMPFKDSAISLEQAVNNMGLAEKQTMNICGALLLANNTEHKLPICRIKAVHFAGYNIEENLYLDSREITGRIDEQLKTVIAFIMNNLRLLQKGEDFNTPGVPEIPMDVITELVVNALVHRDFFINALIRIMIFRDRLEIISPGSLPNNLTLEMIKAGVSTRRNPTLAAYALQVLPYHGVGSGIKRVLHLYPDIEFINDKERNQFMAILKRKEVKE